MKHMVSLLLFLSLFSSGPCRAQETPGHTIVLDEKGQPSSLQEVISPGPTLIIFWRLDSKPSREAVVHVYQNLARIQGKGIRPVAIATSPQRAAADFLRSQGIRMDSFYDPGGKVAATYELGYVYPSLLLLDENLRVQGQAEGGGASFDTHLSRLLERSGNSDHRPNWILGGALIVIAALTFALSR
ncbi:MAG: redoxin domain-containing protein [Candidatus Eisenbacteria sp.]|nr:redoxin domain-containing protein [Candidatus Eisenbacteria bacterium]